MTFPWPWPKVMAVPLIIQSLQNWFVAIFHQSYLLFDYILKEYSLKFRKRFFVTKHNFWAYLRNGWFDWCEMKSVFIDWMLGQLRDLAYWPDLNLGVSRSNFETAVSQKRMGKVSDSIWCLAAFVASTLSLFFFFFLFQIYLYRV